MVVHFRNWILSTRAVLDVHVHNEILYGLIKMTIQMCLNYFGSEIVGFSFGSVLTGTSFSYKLEN